ILTPTYHVFDMYKVHQDATLLACHVITQEYSLNNKKIPALNVSSCRSADGSVNIRIVNLHPTKSIELYCYLRGVSVKTVNGQILTAKEVNTRNTFENPNTIKPENFDKAKLKNDIVSLAVPAKSVVVLRVK